jgi:hypothetical protein
MPIARWSLTPAERKSQVRLDHNDNAADSICTASKYEKELNVR